MREGRRKGKDKHFKHALLPNARHAVVRRPRVVCKVAERDSDEISEKLCFGENVRNWWVGLKVEGGKGGGGVRRDSHVAEIRGDLHGGAAVHVLPHVPPQLQRRRAQADPTTNTRDETVDCGSHICVSF